MHTPPGSVDMSDVLICRGRLLYLTDRNALPQIRFHSAKRDSSAARRPSVMEFQPPAAAVLTSLVSSPVAPLSKLRLGWLEQEVGEIALSTVCR